ncbi:hypothetical protein Cgig2_014417 [Carnegiea gigantea]|uniref:Uncharacterized protein n=1 Tax=Carnegiea gigantea TaxID=171969 RepID=A0A9Q1JJ93_9CARY|nr:hypothetical protein Cgig2_014417 [Carnegiea gigantea]
MSSPAHLQILKSRASWMKNLGVQKSFTTKNKLGNILKVFVCSKQGYRKPRKTPPQSTVALANVISSARENVEERRVKQRRVETREGRNARMVVSSMNNGQFKPNQFNRSLKNSRQTFEADFHSDGIVDEWKAEGECSSSGKSIDEAEGILSITQIDRTCHAYHESSISLFTSMP